MSFLSNAHTHTPYCDGQSDIQTMVRTAQALGFVSLGFSGHAMQGFDWKYCMSPEGQQAYYDELRALQKKHIGQKITPKIYIGVEQDTLVPPDEKIKNRDTFDYIIGSAHYLIDKANGQALAVDGPKDILERLVNDSFGGDPLEMAGAYYRLVAAAIQHDKPDIIGHFDLVRKHAGAIGLDTGRPAYRRAALNALEAAFQGCKLLEVNTGIIARGYDALPHPAGFLLDAWREMGGEITLTSDCHNAKDLDCAYAQTLSMLKKTGYKSLRRLGTGDSLWDEFQL